MPRLGGGLVGALASFDVVCMISPTTKKQEHFNSQTDQEYRDSLVPYDSVPLTISLPRWTGRLVLFMPSSLRERCASTSVPTVFLQIPVAAASVSLLYSDVID